MMPRSHTGALPGKRHLCPSRSPSGGGGLHDTSLFWRSARMALTGTMTSGLLLSSQVGRFVRV